LWSKAGSYQLLQQKAQKAHDENEILHEFLETRCQESRLAFQRTMTNFMNELNALSRVTQYLKMHVFNEKNGWGKSIMATISKPYKWKLESQPSYINVKGTYSTVAHGFDPQSCRSSYSTVFSKLRILTQERTNQAYIDPNDLTHSNNFNVKRTESMKSGRIQCALFPAGIPVGRASTCTDAGHGVKSVINLKGTNYKFGDHALKMFKVLGQNTVNSKVRISKDRQVITLIAKGRCADLYGDDLSALDADYRSDPIPLELVNQKK